MTKAVDHYQQLIETAAASQAGLIAFIQALTTPGDSRLGDIVLDEDDKRQLAKVAGDLIWDFVPPVQPVGDVGDKAIKVMNKKSLTSNPGKLHGF